MTITESMVPAKLLVDRELLPSAKILWMAIRIDRNVEPEKMFSPTRLAKRTGLTRPTVRRAISQISSSKWRLTAEGELHDPRRVSRLFDPRVRMPIDLLTDGTIPALARVLYGVLQQTPDYRRLHGEFTYTSLGQIAGIDARAARKGIRELAEAGWVEINQLHKRSVVRFKLIHPLVAASERELSQVMRRIDRAKFVGEALMREYLSILVDSTYFEDDAAPGFLVNPLTGERLQLDRYYPVGVAFEFNGPQHYGETELFSAEEASMQRVRDYIKAGICAERGITLVVVHPEDLSLERMRRIVGNLLPLRDLHGQTPVIRYLESRSRTYRKFARRAGWGEWASRRGGPP